MLDFLMVNVHNSYAITLVKGFNKSTVTTVTTSKKTSN